MLAVPIEEVATKPATPHVFRAPVDVHVLGVRRQIARPGLHLDQPDRFVEALKRARAALMD